MTRLPVQLPVYDAGQRALYHRIAGSIAAVAAAFCLVLVTVLVVTFIRDRAGSPLVTADLLQTRHSAPPGADPYVARMCDLQLQLAKDPQNKQLQDDLRNTDLAMRLRHFDRRHQLVFGSWLLVGGMAVLLLSLKARMQFAATPPGVMTVFTPPANPHVAARHAQGGIAVAGAAVIAALLLLSLRGGETFPFPVPPPVVAPIATATSQPAPVLRPPPTHEQWMANWPCFRGPSGCGLTYNATPPKSWDGPANQGILWKVPVPLAGQNSPIVWDDRIFLSGATRRQQQVFCYSTADGKLLWQKTVAASVDKPTEERPSEGEQEGGEARATTGYAAPTMACDGQRSYAIFSSGDIAAFDLDGIPVWAKNLGHPNNPYGHASSLAVYHDRVIIQFDQQGGDATEESEGAGRSNLIALDGPTGKVLYRTRRSVAASWASPIVIYPAPVTGGGAFGGAAATSGAAAGPQIITAACPLVVAYNPDDGKEIWSAKVLAGDVAPGPAFANNLVYVANQTANLSALRIDGHGDIGATGIAWAAEDGMPDICSPLATENIVLLCQSDGIATCYDAKSGKKLWDHDFAVDFHASPVVVDKTIYLIDLQGVTHVFAAAADFKEIAAYPLGEAVGASPAFVGGRIYIRAKSNLYCIGGK